MPHLLADLEYPHERVFLPRTKLAYVHLRNLLTDAKRDRAARVFGYVAIWLPDEMVVLYLQSGELVNATTFDGRTHGELPIAEALERVPGEPEFGEIAFLEADDEQLACMYAAQATAPEPWPAEMDPRDPGVIFPFLMATTFDGAVEIIAGGRANYLIFRDGTVERAYLAGTATGSMVERVQRLFLADRQGGQLLVRRWPVPAPLPQQAPPALIHAYRDLTNRLVQRLVATGRESAPAIAEHARRTLTPSHDALASFTVMDRATHDPVTDVDTLTNAVAAWVSEILWTAADLDTVAPEDLLRELTHDRRHMFDAAGFFDRIPFRVEW